MAFKVKSLLKNKKTLYVVAFLAVTNVFSFLLSKKFDALFYFCVLGLATTYFSKNMIIVLLVPMLVINLLIKMNIIGKKMYEGLENKEESDKKDDNDKEKEKEKDGKVKDKKDLNEIIHEVGEIKSNEKKSKVDYAATLEEAYSNLDNLIGGEGIAKMSEDTKRLADKQKELMKNIESMGPMLKNAGKMLENLPLEGLGDLQGTISKAVTSLNGFNKEK
jgi:hypothetical protein